MKAQARVNNYINQLINTPPRETEIAYFAGIFDGEGCIQIKKNKPTAKLKNPTYCLHICVGNTDARMILFINNIFPSYVQNRCEKRANRRRQFLWVANGYYASLILQKILPFLIIKKDQAEVFIKCAKTFEEYYGVFGTPKEIVELREKYRVECMDLKTIEFPPFPSGESKNSKKKNKDIYFDITPNASEKIKEFYKGNNFQLEIGENMWDKEKNALVHK